MLVFDMYYFLSLTNMLWKKTKYSNKLKQLKESESHLEYKETDGVEILDSF